MISFRSLSVVFVLAVLQLLGGWSAVAKSNEMTQSAAQIALAEFLPEGSIITDRLWRQVEIKLNLTQQVPYRIYFRPSPNRVILEFGTVAFQNFDADRLLSSRSVKKAEVRVLRSGWSRMSLELTKPLGIQSAEMQRVPTSDAALLSLWLEPVSEKEFNALAQLYAGTENLEVTGVAQTTLADKTDRIRIVLDPGHGGEDPGALADGLKESDLMLRLAFEVKEALMRVEQFDVFLTRTDDRFVSLRERLAFATEKKADLFISLHADAISEGIAFGTTVYTLSETASDELSETLAHEHDRASLLVGSDLSSADDTIADILIEMASTETMPRSEALADVMVEELFYELGAVNSKPLRKADFTVLKSPDIPSILIEAGFLSTQSDLDNLIDPLWREKFGTGVQKAIQNWVASDVADAIRRRQ